jgi:hypothetical protein
VIELHRLWRDAPPAPLQEPLTAAGWNKHDGIARRRGR